MKPKILSIDNQKGGVGKSTIALLLANYLSEKGLKVCLLDADLQKTIYKVRQEEISGAEIEESSFKYDVFLLPTLDTISEDDLLKILSDSRKSYDVTLIDLPGNLAQNMISQILVESDYILCPFEYESKVLSSTSDFIVVLQKLFEILEVNIPLFFIPNRVRKGVGTAEEKEVYSQIDDVFRQYGTLLPPIHLLQAITRADSISLTREQRAILDPVFSPLLRLITNE